MKTPHRSISQRLDRAKSPEAKQATLNEWLDDWDAANERFAQAALAGDSSSSEWCEDVKKRLAAIPNIFLKLQVKVND
jgi:hypothetical protein